MSKLAVFFPGIGYTADKPLMHYSRRIAADHGYEIMIMAYTGFPKKVKGDRGRMEESFAIAMRQSIEMLSGVNLADYEDIVFVGKSIGTVVAAKTASESPVKDRIRLVLFTPLAETFSWPFGEAIAFTGDDDPWVGKSESPIPGICEKRGIPCEVIAGANHSLESGDVFEDVRVILGVMGEVGRFFVG